MHDARTRAHAVAAIPAEVIDRMAMRPEIGRPRARERSKRDGLLADRIVRRTGDGAKVHCGEFGLRPRIVF